MVDSGAARSLIKESVLRQLDLVIEKTNVKLNDVLGEPIEIIGSVWTEIKMESLELPMRLIIVKDLAIKPDIVLGVDFLDKFQVTVKFSKDSRKMIIHDVMIDPLLMNSGMRMMCSVPQELTNVRGIEQRRGTNRARKIRVVADREQLIPAFSYKTIQVKAKRRLPEKCLIHFIPTTSNSNYQGVEMVNEACKGKFSIIILNRNGQAVTITKSTFMGYLEIVWEDQDIMAEEVVQMSAILQTDDGQSVEQKGIKERTREEKLRILLAQARKHALAGTSEYEELKGIITDFLDTFSLDDEPLSVTGTVFHSIEIEKGRPIFTRPYRIAEKYREEVRTEIQNMLKRNIIRPSHSPWCSPLVVVPKKDTGQIRLVVDFRKINELVKRDQHPIPVIERILTQLRGSKYFTKLDLAQGFHQIPLDEKSKEITAFSTEDAIYEYQTMPMGLANSPATFSRLMNMVFWEEIGHSVQVYLDDILIPGRTFTEHIANIRTALTKLKAHNLKVRYSKCDFFAKEVQYLGHMINSEGIKPVHDKLEAIRNYPVPRTAKEVLRFLGMCGYYRRFVRQYSKIVRPLYELTKSVNEFEWTETAHRVFETLKDKMCSAGILVYPDFKKKFIIYTDASDTGVGGVISQKDSNNHERVVAYYSRTLTAAEKNYSVTEKEALGIVSVLRKYRWLLVGFQVEVRTDHQPLTFLFREGPQPNGRLARWALLLQEYQLKVTYVQGLANKVADALSRTGVRDTDDEVASIDAIQSTKVDAGKKPADSEELAVVIEWSVEELKSEQRKHPVWGQVIRYLKGRATTGSLGRKIRVQEFHLDENGILYRMVENFRGRDHQKRQTVLTDKFIQKALHLCHALPEIGHGGIALTTERVKENFYWIGIGPDVINYVTHCDSCQRNKPYKVPKAPLLRHSEVTSPFQRVHVDLQGPLVKTDKGNKYILVAVDALTRYSEIVPLPNKEARTVAQGIVEQIFLRHGRCEKLVSDMGTEFLNQILKEVCNLLRVDQCPVAPMHPSSNGLVEHANGRIKTMLRHFVADNQKNWDEFLPYIQMAVNSSYNRAIGDSAHYMLYHTDPVLPYDTFVRQEPILFYNIDDYKTEVSRRAQIAFNLAQIHLHQAARENEMYRLRRSTLRMMKVGDRVFMRNTPKPGLSRKLQALWQGPYRVMEVKSPVIFKIRNVASGKSRMVHLDNIRRIEEIRGQGEDLFPTDVLEGSKDSKTLGMDHHEFCLEDSEETEEIIEEKDDLDQGSHEDITASDIGRSETNGLSLDGRLTIASRGQGSTGGCKTRRHSYNLRPRGPRV